MSSRLFPFLLAASVGCLLLPVEAQSATEPLDLKVSVEQPRAYGWQLGDVIERRLQIDVPERLKLDERSLPPVAKPGGPFELRAIDRRRETVAGGERLSMTLRYQLFVSPRETRIYELPGFTLHFKGTPRDEDARVESWPIAAAPLTPIDASSRDGLGELRPDAATPLPDVSPYTRRLVVWGVLALLLAAYLLHRRFGDRLWMARRRPFARAWRDLRRLDATAGSAAIVQAQRRLHRAFDDAAGRALFTDGALAFVRERGLGSALQAEVQRFYARSQAVFFGGEAPSAEDARQVLALARALHEAERTAGGLA